MLLVEKKVRIDLIRIYNFLSTVFLRSGQNDKIYLGLTAVPFNVLQQLC